MVRYSIALQTQHSVAICDQSSGIVFVQELYTE